MTPIDLATEAPSPARRLLLMVVGLLLLAAIFVFAVPRRAEIAASMAPPFALEVPDVALNLDAPADGPDSAASDEPPVQAEATGTPAPATTTAPQAPAVARSPVGDLPAAEEPKPEPEKPATAQVLTRPIAIDTATFLVGRARVKLRDVEPSAVGRRCATATGGTWPCGAQARTALRAWLRARSIRCDVPEDFARSSSTTTSVCALGNQDIGAWLVENGWAQATPDGSYAEAETKARQARLGLWGTGPSATRLPVQAPADETPAAPVEPNGAITPPPATGAPSTP